MEVDLLSLRGKRVVVTGAGGFIGSHLTEALAREGADVQAVVHYNALGSWGWLDESPARDEITVHLADVQDPGSLSAAMKEADVVFHLAALIGIPYSYAAPRSYVRTNVEGTLNILELAREHGVSRVVHTSTSEAYGTARYAPIDEEHPLQGQSPYAATKIGADKLAQSYHLSFGLPVVTVRPFNTFGPRQSARAVIPTIISQCLTGNEVRLGNLTPTRDLNYVSNTVDGFLRAAESSRAIGRTVNLGSGREISIGELAAEIVRLCGRDVRIVSEEARVRPDASEVGRLIASNNLAEELLGWTPGVTLEEGLSRTIEWMRSHLDRYRPTRYAL
ncbi:MAG TPA: GDP-mannose 4,6-dehydratase [Candidatus Thermoplasmatota archaeon]|nr:GDP-mannose 4,6-dehydratase [Candidatus Thermoplasmatota archaeon]